MSYAQRFLNEFFQIEIYHSLGSYASVVNQLKMIKEDLRKKKETNEEDYDSVINIMPEELMQAIIKYNEVLRDQIHRSDRQYRHPCPPEQKGSDYKMPDEAEMNWGEGSYAPQYILIVNLYHAAVEMLKLERENSKKNNFQQLDVGFIFEPDILPLNLHQFDQKYKDEKKYNELRKAIIHRFKRRKKEAETILNYKSDNYKDIGVLIGRLMYECLECKRKDSIHRFIIRASVEVHFRMHYIEHLRSALFEDLMKERDKIYDKAVKHLEYCICVNTFIYTISRAAPWIFAEDTNERNLILNSYDKGRIHIIPPRCMWIAQQLSLLALYRRAYSHCLLGNSQRSFNDYLKVQRLARNARRNISLSATHVHGAHQFLMAIDALCEYRMGELYRRNHAHTCASEHFNRAYDRLEELRKIQDLKAILEESRWRIKLIVGMGKSFFELGYIKRSLKWYLIAWRAFLNVTAEDSDLEINTKETDENIEWLTQIRNEPDLCKTELIKYVAPFVTELKTARISPRLRGLAAEILNRIAHNLFILKLGKETDAPLKSGEEVKDELHSLAFECVRLASEYDPKNTLAHSKILSIMKNREIDPDPVISLEGDQWPLGGGRFERFSRVYEHYLLKEAIDRFHGNGLPENNEGKAANIVNTDETKMAASLMVDFLTQTDSSNVKLSLIYKYLAKKRRSGPTFKDEKPRLEFICLRRYSSFFPFLPRPSSFRTLGGGYLVRLHGAFDEESKSKDSEPFGIAIDPGSDYVENLYRTGYSLADIDMIIVTHDHADHIAGLDPLLTLMDYRGKLSRLSRKENENRAEENKNTKEIMKLVVLGNESVKNRYSFYNKKSKYVLAWRFDEWDEQKTLLPKQHPLRSLGLEIKSFEGTHLDSAKNNAYGIRISIGDNDGPSIGITSDTKFPEEYEGKKWPEVIDSDVLIAHLSSVPLSQLRQQAGVWGKDQNLDWLNDIWGNIKKSDKFHDNELQRQIEFAFWLQGEKEVPLLGKFESYNPPGKHLYLDGIIEFAKTYQKKRKGNSKGGLFIVSELREELATFRTKVAKVLNDYIFKPNQNNNQAESNKRSDCMALTADLGLSLVIEKNGEKPVMRVLCSNCDVDNDYTPDERYHDPTKIYEVCIKGEDEGIFYNCHNHDPGTQEKPSFLERMEQYDIFSRHIN